MQPVIGKRWRWKKREFSGGVFFLKFARLIQKLDDFSRFSRFLGYMFVLGPSRIRVLGIFVCFSEIFTKFAVFWHLFHVFLIISGISRNFLKFCRFFDRFLTNFRNYLKNFPQILRFSGQIYGLGRSWISVLPNLFQFLQFLRNFAGF